MEKNGGPAFPRGPIGEDCGEPYGQQAGMTLRDWFAGQALAGIVANPECSGSFDSIAEWSYDYADAMLKAREQ